MKDFVFRHLIKKADRRRTLHDYDWEIASEIAPDPFSDEEHTRLHKSRFSNNRNYLKNRDNSSNQKKK